MSQDFFGRALLTGAAGVLFALGMPLLFAADNVANAVGAPGPAVEGLAQVAASGLLGLGVINWWWRGNLVGGIAGRPLGLGNLLCFLSLSATLGRAARGHGAGGGPAGAPDRGLRVADVPLAARAAPGLPALTPGQRGVRSLRIR